jgi:TolB-like protein/DNA-binding winged helix-turn-helix (wHTH) protein/Tfp pilus assembly protein PilF
MPNHLNELYEFGEFQLDADRRLLLRGGERLRLNSKAFETLLVLVRNRVRVMTKDELMQALWPHTFVEEVNLAQNISAVRKVLGEAPGENRFIATLPGKGYQFVCEVHEPARSLEQPPSAPQPLAVSHAALELIPAAKAGTALSTWRWSAWVWAGIGVAIAIGIAGTGYVLKSRAVARQEGHSLAVLPFQPLTGTEDADHLGLGMADAVITKLSNIRQLPVRPTDVAIRYSDPKQDPLQAARAMGVDAVLIGKIQKGADRIRVTVQLVQVTGGRTLWAQTFDENATNIFSVEDSISEKVAQALVAHLGSEDRERLARHYTENIDAYRNYLEGRYEEFTFTPDGMHKAIEHFNRAIAVDPGYALAYAGLADAYTTESDWLLPPREAMPKADAAARKALAFDENLAEAHGALAHALLHEWRLDESSREFQNALALNPSNVSTYFAYSEYLASVGRFDDAVATMKHALTIDPLSPEINSFLSWDYYLGRDYDNCLLSSHNALQMFPDFWLPHLGMGMCLYMKGEFPEAVQSFTKALAINPLSTYAQSGVAMSLAKAGRRAESLQALEGLKNMKKDTYVSPVYVALVYHALDDEQQEFSWLEKGYQDRAEWLLWLKFEPMFDGQRDDPRFQALVRKVGI